MVALLATMAAQFVTIGPIEPIGLCSGKCKGVACPTGGWAVDNGAVQTSDAPRPGQRSPVEGPDGRPTPVPTWVGPVVGIVAMAAGMVTAELVAALRDGAASPVVEVGNRVVDLVPKPVRDWAISTFGTSDKAVLLFGVFLVLAALAALAGHWMTSGRRSAAVGLVAAIVVAGALSPLGRGGAGVGSVFATLLGGVVSVVVLLWLARMAEDAWPPLRAASNPVPATGQEPEPSPESMVQPIGPTSAALSRRRFFGATAGVGVASVAAGAVASWLRSGAAVTAERLGITLPKPVQPLPDIPPDVSLGIDGVSPFITPTSDFYRIDTALVVPRVSTEDWTLKVTGRVDDEVTLDYETLLERPMIELDATIACVSNEVGGDLVGTARWLGCRLDDLLAEAGIDPSADQVVGRSVDGFTAGFPTAVLDGRDAIIAVGMNGEPLPTDHGYPARLIVPGLYGYVSATKWLAEIELTRFDEFEGYWIPRGWDVEAPVVPSSRIDTPRNGAEVPAGQTLPVGGVAWAPVQGIAAVEVSVDDGPWEQARLGEEYVGTTWRQWGMDLVPAPGEHTIAVRATDAEGEIQTAEITRPGPNAATGHHTIRVTAT